MGPYANKEKEKLSEQYIIKNLSYDKDTGSITRIVKYKDNLIKDAGSNKDGYICIRIGGKLLRSHRIAWFLHYGEWPNGIIDHIDRDKKNNKIENLRVVSFRENNKNSKRSDNIFRGVVLKSGTYRSRLTINKKYIPIGSYKCRYQAAMAVICFENNEIQSSKGIYYRDL